MHDDLEQARVFNREPIVDALVPYFFLWDVKPEEVLANCADREAYLARYGRISPSEIHDMDPDHVARLVGSVSKLIEAEYKARASNPLDPTTEDMSE